MIRNEKTYAQAVEFRKRGFTYSEIAKICDISVSTVSNWLSSKSFSKRVKQTNTERAARDNKKRMVLLNKARQAERATRYQEAIRSAETEYKHYKAHPLFIAGLMLYLGRGDCTDRKLIRLATARMEVHRIFMQFAAAYLGAHSEQVRFWLHLYPNLDEKACVKRWSRDLRLSPKQFYKNQIIQGHSEKRTLQYGVGNTIIGSTVLKHKLNRWIELATKELAD